MMATGRLRSTSVGVIIRPCSALKLEKFAILARDALIWTFSSSWCRMTRRVAAGLRHHRRR